MSDSFIREYRLVLGEANTSSTRSQIESAVITQSHIEFEVTKTSDSKANGLDLRIYNLARDTIDLFDRKDVLISLEAGYATRPLSLIFRGNKTSMITRKEGTEIITTITAADGYVSIREGRVNSSYGESVTVEAVIRDIVAKSMPEIKAVNISGEATKKKYNNGYSVSGSAKRNLDIICNAFSLEWHIINGDVLNVLSRDGDIKKNAVLLTPSNGLIESVEKTSQEIKDLKKAVKAPKDKGVKFKCLLNSDIEPGGLIKIQDTMYADGIYKVEQLVHRGSFEGSEWVTIVEAVEK